jgi:hypothetical protein
MRFSMIPTPCEVRDSAMRGRPVGSVSPFRLPWGFVRAIELGTTVVHGDGPPGPREAVRSSRPVSPE